MKGLHKGRVRKVDNPLKWMEEDKLHSEIKEELQKFLSENDYILNLVGAENESALLLVAKHFANLNRIQGDDLEKAAEQYSENVLAGGEDMFDAIADGFIEGANWQRAQTRDEHFWNGMQHAKEELMKESVEADIMLTNEEFGKQTYVELCFRPKRRIYSNKVRIIILKEED